MAVINTGKWYKTSRGEVYEKCGIRFGAEPVEVPAATLEKVSKRAELGRTIGEWLESDRRLVEVEAPAKAKGGGASAEAAAGASDNKGDKAK